MIQYKPLDFIVAIAAWESDLYWLSWIQQLNYAIDLACNRFAIHAHFKRHANRSI